MTNWERIIQQCWERLPALDALAAHSQQFILRILIPRIFHRGYPSNPQWDLVSDEASVALTGWRRYRGSFDIAFPRRQVALYVGENEPSHWPEDADVACAMMCDSGTSAAARPLVAIVEPGRILLRMPVLRALEDALPAELARYRKFIQPEPFRPAMVLAALHDLYSVAEPEAEIDDSGAVAVENASEPRQIAAFVAAASDFLLRELLEGSIDTGLGHSLTLRGPELIRALFSRACRHIFPDYLTLARTPKWREMLKLYREGLRSPQLSLAQRQGQEEICGSKVELYQRLFQQKSTAAGDSLIRALGPLAKLSGDSQAFVLRLALHPAEVALL